MIFQRNIVSAFALLVSLCSYGLAQDESVMADEGTSFDEGGMVKKPACQDFVQTLTTPAEQQLFPDPPAQSAPVTSTGIFLTQDWDLEAVNAFISCTQVQVFQTPGIIEQECKFLVNFVDGSISHWPGKEVLTFFPTEEKPFGGSVLSFAITGGTKTYFNSWGEAEVDCVFPNPNSTDIPICTAVGTICRSEIGLQRAIAAGL